MNWVFEGLKKCNTFWLGSAMLEAEANQGTGKAYHAI